MSSILEPRLLTRLARIQLSSKRRLVGSASGGHRSKRHGSSLDFADYREYQPGDDGYRKFGAQGMRQQAQADFGHIQKGRGPDKYRGVCSGEQS